MMFPADDLRQALQDLSTAAGVPIVSDETVVGEVYADLQGVSLESALEMMLAGTSYEMAKTPTYYIVGDRKVDSSAFPRISETRRVYIVDGDWLDDDLQWLLDQIKAKQNATAVVLTHDHSDHTCLESLERIHAAHPRARYVGPVESIERIRGAGVPQELLTPVAAGEMVELGSISAGVVWSKPPEGAPANGIDPPGVQHVGYVFRIGAVRVYVTGDLINTFADHEELLQPVAALEPDLALLTCHPTEGEFPYFEGAVKLSRRLELKAVVPAHYDCFAKRTYDPRDFATQFAGEPARVIVVPYNGSVVYPEGGR